MHTWHVINIIKISDCVVATGCVCLPLLLLSKPKVLDSSLVVSHTIWLDHFHSWLIYFRVLCSCWSHSFLLTSKITTLWSTSRAFVCWRFVFMSLISTIIWSIIVQKCTSSHICWKSMTSFYFFEILLFTLDRILIRSLTIRNRRHFRHQGMRSFFVFFLISAK